MLTTFSQGKFIDQNRKIDNVKKNGELSEREKCRSIDRIKRLPLGTTEQEDLNDSSKQTNIVVKSHFQHLILKSWWDPYQRPRRAAQKRLLHFGRPDRIIQINA